MLMRQQLLMMWQGVNKGGVGADKEALLESRRRAVKRSLLKFFFHLEAAANEEVVTWKGEAPRADV